MASGYELITAITNLAIFIASIIILIKLKYDKIWNIFYILISIDSFLGIIVHGINMNKNINDFLWGILSISLVLTINTLLIIFVGLKKKYYLITSFLIITILILEIIFNLNYVITFVIYAIIVVLLSTYFMLKNNYKNKNYFLIGIINQIIGIIPTFLKIGIGNFNHNCITHTFTLITIIIFYLGIKKSQ